MKIGMQAVQKAADMSNDLLVNTKTIEKMNHGLLSSDDESLTVTMKIKFSPGEKKPVKVSVSMSFPVEKHKEELKDEIDEMQISLFTEKPAEEPPKIAQSELDSREGAPI